MDCSQPGVTGSVIKKTKEITNSENNCGRRSDPKN